MVVATLMLMVEHLCIGATPETVHSETDLDHIDGNAPHANHIDENRALCPTPALIVPGSNIKCVSPVVSIEFVSELPVCRALVSSTNFSAAALS